MADSNVLELTRRQAATIVNWYPFLTPERITSLDKSLVTQLMKAIKTSGAEGQPDSIYLDAKVSRIAIGWYEHLVDGLIDPLDVETHDRIETFLAEVTQGGELGSTGSDAN